MNEFELSEIFDAAYEREFAVFDDAPEHKFSFRHRRKMQKILFPEAEQIPSGNRIVKRKISLKRSTLVVALLIFLALIAGAVSVFRIAGFSGTVNDGIIHLFTTNDATAPSVIEKRYDLTKLPEDFKFYERAGDEGEEWLHRVYINRSDNTRLTFNQKTKAMFAAHYPDTENRKFEEVDINGNKGYLWRDGNDIYGHTMKTLVWDNGEYIFELHGEISKNMLLNLARSAKYWGE